MPVHKFRRVEEMPEWSWYEPGDPELWQAIRNLHRTFELTHPAPTRRAGVRRFRCWEEVDRADQGADHTHGSEQGSEG